MENIHTKLEILAVYLADTRFGKVQRDLDITEMWNLVQSLGNAGIMDLVEQKGKAFDATYVGPGKADQIAGYVKENPIDIVLVYGNLTPNQKFNLTKKFWNQRPSVKVWDRIDLILAIFSEHAHTQEAKLQIELAKMRHMGPSIFGMGKILSRQGAGIGTRGIGETNTELMKRHWRREINRVTALLKKLESTHLGQIEKRKNQNIKTVSLVGYTNAGKSTLFSELTKKDTYIHDQLFATLDSKVGSLTGTKNNMQILVSDTIGFIRDLPPELIDAFRSTLLESTLADTVLHVIDVSDPEIDRKMEVVGGILKQLEIPDDKILLVFNKMDLVHKVNSGVTKRSFPDYPRVFVSAKNGKGIGELTEKIVSRIKE